MKKKYSEWKIIFLGLFCILAIYFLCYYAAYVSWKTNDYFGLILSGFILGTITTEVLNNIVFPFGFKYNKLILESKRGDEY